MPSFSFVRHLSCILFVIVGNLCVAQGQQPTIENYRRKIVGVDQILAEFERLKRDPKYLAQMQDLRVNIKAELSGLYHTQPQLGALSVSEMFARFDKVLIGWNTSQLPFQADLERDSDFYLPGRNIAILNSELEKASPIGRLGVIIHVMFGASGHDDEHYQRTLGVLIAEMQIRDPQSFKTVNIQHLFPSSREQLVYQQSPGDRRIIEFSDDANKRVIIAEKNQRKETLLAGGGFTGVGGGGDSSAFTVKYAMIQLNPVADKLLNPTVAAKCIRAWQNYTNYLLDVMNVPMESISGSTNVHMHQSDKGRSIAVPKTYGYSHESMRELALQGLEVLCRNKYIYPAW